MKERVVAAAMVLALLALPVLPWTFWSFFWANHRLATKVQELLF